MCLAASSNSSSFIGDGANVEYRGINRGGAGASMTSVSNSPAATVDSSSKMLGAVLTSLVALYVGMNRFNMTVYLVEQSSSASKPIACCGILVVLAIRKVWNDRLVSMVDDCSQKVDNVMLRVSSNKTLTRIKSSSMRLLDLATGRHEGGDSCGSGSAEQRLSPKLSIQSSPFVSLDIISELSLSDVKDLFRYALEVSRYDFDRHAFLFEISSRNCREAIQGIDRAVLSSRGKVVTAATTTTTTTGRATTHTMIEPIQRSLHASDIDALYFVAVICIFAEWRTIRLVPPSGYHHRYSIGMGLAKRDLIQNANKIECAVHRYMNECDRKNRKTDHQISPPNPTLRQLIEWEIDNNVHQHLPHVLDKSSSSGLLWIYRQVQYQCNVFQNILHIPDTYPTSKAAVTAAYRTTYDDYHGFFIKKIFISSFEVAPSHVEILQHMNPVTCISRTGSSTERVTIPQNKSTNINVLTQREPNPWELVANHFIGEWTKLERFISQCHGQHVKWNENRNGLIVPQKDRSTLDLSSYTTIGDAKIREHDRGGMTATSPVSADEDLRSFSDTLQPILYELQTFINTANINDPSKC